MTTATAELSIVSTGDIARRFGVSEHMVRRVLDRIGLGQKIGRYRVVAEDDLDTVEVALRAAGYLDRAPTSRPDATSLSFGVEMKKPSGPGQGNPDGMSRNPSGEGPSSDALCDEG